MIEHWNYSGLPPVERYNAAVDRANELMAALKAARDLLVGCQKHAGQIPGQGYAATLTEHEMALAKGIESVDAIISQADGKAIVVADIRQGLRRWVQSNKYGLADDAKAEGK